MTFEVKANHRNEQVILLRCCGWKKEARTDGARTVFIVCEKCKSEYAFEEKYSVVTGKTQWVVK